MNDPSFNSHARFQMGERGVTREQVILALTTYHTSYPAEPLPYANYTSTIYVATIDGRELKVYVRDGSDPPVVTTVAWKDR